MKGLIAGAALALTSLSAQEFGSLDNVPAKNRQYVVYAAEQQVVPAGKRAVLELRFRVLEGYHVNSHTPKSELLIPTRVELEAAAGVKAAAAEYPAGKTFSFSFDPSAKVDVYADAFTVKLPVTASAGPHEIHGALKYQACDQAACYPPRSLPISVIFTAK
jgi:DsbC/DsbD-like thiol-disulfide interchange protein